MIYLLSNSNYGMTCKEKLSCLLDHFYSQFLGKQEKINTWYKTSYRWKQFTEASLSDYGEDNLDYILIKEQNVSLFLGLGLSAFSVSLHIYKKWFQRGNGCTILNKLKFRNCHHSYSESSHSLISVSVAID